MDFLLPKDMIFFQIIPFFVITSLISKKKYGISSVFEGSFFNFSSENEMWSYYSRMAYSYMYNTKPSKLIRALYNLVKNKPYFIITSNTDSHFSMAGFEQSSIFEIEGSMKDMQCSKGCHNTVYPNKKYIFNMLEHEIEMEIPSQHLPKCPVCGGHMQMHIPINQFFVKDKKWKEQYKNYHSFIEYFHNKKLLILEFGVGARNQLIKAPFMNLAYSEPNAFYITFNKGELYIPHQIIDKSMAVDGDISIILPQMFEYYKSIYTTV